MWKKPSRGLSPLPNSIATGFFCSSISCNSGLTIFKTPPIHKVYTTKDKTT
ncbi:lipoprotein, putative [Nitratidesulfovibrio vulgaris str. Hildenborough]|uniref:Lipoprotein, putative n=1 Tax=Nitratidesulfovibrio vulgaris (strain ATCC 29579 / DSM 644 / CCUG 34227 / NCIMB 8303 / VKM B-1760 / Hildenborough) TaxID=882 RepID=Q72EL9_NITV2|nr:lipoprotein, putative [Nitratidesulfovibrio vulgaris str. Hildenborough]